MQRLTQGNFANKHITNNVVYSEVLLTMKLLIQVIINDVNAAVSERWSRLDTREEHVAENRTEIRNKSTLLQFYEYRLAERLGFSAIHLSGKLFQQ